MKFEQMRMVRNIQNLELLNKEMVLRHFGRSFCDMNNCVSPTRNQIKYCIKHRYPISLNENLPNLNGSQLAKIRMLFR